MKRLLLLLTHEFRLARMTVAIHLVAILEPAVMYALLTVILVHPTLDVYVTRPTTVVGQALVAAMQDVGSPIGLPYIRPFLVEMVEPHNVRQVITVEERNGVATAVQRYNLIDENLVKNYRNRLTAAALRLWNGALESRAVTLVEYPSLPRDIPYNVYFGMAMLPLAVFMAASIIGGALTTQEFEFHTVQEYRLSPVSLWLTLAARLLRLLLSGWIGAGVLLVTIGLINGYWPDSIGWVALILLPVAVIGGCLGMVAGLLTRATLPAFLIGVVSSFVFWIVGNAIRPAVVTGGWFERLSRLTPNAYAFNLLFPHFYGTEIGSTPISILILTLGTVLMIALTALIYRRQIFGQE